MLEGWIQTMESDVLAALFADFYPLWIDSAGEDYEGNKYLMYYGLSEHFHEIEDGDEIPMYEATVILGEMVNYIEFTEVED